MNHKARELNRDALFHLAMRRWRLSAFVLLLTLFAAGVAWSVTPDRYESRAQLLIQDQHTVNPFLKDLLEEWSAKQRLPLIEGLFRSHDTSELVLRKLGRLDDTSSPEEVNRAVESFQAGFQVIGLGGELVLIRVQGATPSEAYEATTTLVQTFTEQILRPQKETVRASAAFFEDQLERLRGHTTDVSPSVSQMPEVDTVGRNGQLSIHRALAEAEARLSTVEQQVSLSNAKLKRGSRPDSGARVRQLRRDLADARSERTELEHRYGEDHPELEVAKERVVWLREALRREHRRSQDIANQMTGSGPAVPGQQPESNASKASDHGTLMLELREAQAEVELLRQRLLTEELAMFGEGIQVWTVEEPVKPTRSLKPPLSIVLVGASLAGFILAVLAIALFAAFDEALRGEKELAEALGAPSLGRMPLGES